MSGVTPATEPSRGTRFERTVAIARSVTDGQAMRSLTRRRVRALVDRVDETIAACERTHLDGRRVAAEDLVARAEEVAAQVRGLSAEGVDLLGDVRVGGPLPTRVVDLMDQLWVLQERMFDVLTPRRREMLAGEER